jgi:hypothetical protein
MFHPLKQRLAAPYGLPTNQGALAFLAEWQRVRSRAAAVQRGEHGELSRLALTHPTDKGLTFFPFHGYTPNYERLFAAHRGRPITLLEIGLARKRDRNNPRVTCPSLELWADYFPQATLLGFDIDDFSNVKQPRTTIYRGDQGSPADLARVVAAHPRLDIVIDDGSHASWHQQVSLSSLWPALAPDGLYVIEDLDSQPPALEAALPKARRTIEVLRDPAALAPLVQGEAVEVEIFDSPLRGTRDTMACLRRRR